MDTESELPIEDAGKSVTSTAAADETVEAAKLSKDETSAAQQDATKNDNDDNKDGRRGSSSSAVISPVGPVEVNEAAKLAPVAQHENDGSAAKAEGDEKGELHSPKDEVTCHPNDNADTPSKDATDESRKVETSEAGPIAEPPPADGQSEDSPALPESDPATDTQNIYADESQQYDESIYSRPPPLPPTLAPAAARAERRGSGFLLLAAEAYEAAERTQIRADAIRQVAMELAISAVGGPAPASTASAAESMQRQYQDAMLSQGQGSPGTIGPMYTRYPEVQVDGNIREQVYKAAARIQQQHQAQAAAAPPSESRSQEVEGEEAKSPQKGGARRRRSTTNKQESLPPLPPAPLVQPTKQPAKMRSSSNGGPPKGKKDSGENDPLPSGKPRPTPQKHVYHDYSAIPDSEHFVRKKTGGVTMPFPEKLMNMLDKESLLHPDIISWLPHGRAFIVRKPKLFTGEVMGGYFRQSKLTSFQRQLNLYGFRRITQGADGGAYYHELFLRGRPQLSLRMQRQKVKGTGHKQPTDVTSEPNFYAMPTLIEGNRNVATADDDGVAAVETGSFDGPVPPLALPDGALTYSTTRPDETDSPQPSDEVKAQIQAMWNSPGLTAASMLRQLSASSVNPPPFLGLGASSQGNAAEQYYESSFQRAPSAAMGSYATATAATANPNNASDESEEYVEYV